MDSTMKETPFTDLPEWVHKFIAASELAVEAMNDGDIVAKTLTGSNRAKQIRLLHHEGAVGMLSHRLTVGRACRGELFGWNHMNDNPIYDALSAHEEDTDESQAHES